MSVAVALRGGWQRALSCHSAASSTPKTRLWRRCGLFVTLIESAPDYSRTLSGDIFDSSTEITKQFASDFLASSAVAQLSSKRGNKNNRRRLADEHKSHVDTQRALSLLVGRRLVPERNWTVSSKAPAGGDDSPLWLTEARTQPFGSYSPRRTGPPSRSLPLRQTLARAASPPFNSPVTFESNQPSRMHTEPSWKPQMCAAVAVGPATPNHLSRSARRTSTPLHNNLASAQVRDSGRAFGRCIPRPRALFPYSASQWRP